MAQHLVELTARRRRHHVQLFQHYLSRRTKQHLFPGRHPRRHAFGQSLLAAFPPQPDRYVSRGIGHNDYAVSRAAQRTRQEAGKQLGHPSHPPGNETVEHGSFPHVGTNNLAVADNQSEASALSPFDLTIAARSRIKQWGCQINV